MEHTPEPVVAEKDGGYITLYVHVKSTDKEFLIRAKSQASFANFANDIIRHYTKLYPSEPKIYKPLSFSKYKTIGTGLVDLGDQYNVGEVFTNYETFFVSGCSHPTETPAKKRKAADGAKEGDSTAKKQKVEKDTTTPGKNALKKQKKAAEAAAVTSATKVVVAPPKKDDDSTEDSSDDSSEDEKKEDKKVAPKAVPTKAVAAPAKTEDSDSSDSDSDDSDSSDTDSGDDKNKKGAVAVVQLTSKSTPPAKASKPSATDKKAVPQPAESKKFVNIYAEGEETAAPASKKEKKAKKA